MYTLGYLETNHTYVFALWGLNNADLVLGEHPQS